MSDRRCLPAAGGRLPTPGSADWMQQAREKPSLSASARPFHGSDHPLSLGNALWINLLARHRDRQEKMDRDLERTGDLLMQRHRTFTLSRFELRQVALSDAD